MRRAMVVAHPDDETLWGAGWIMRHPGDWTVYACSIPERDPVRALLFHKACEVLGARGIVLPYIEKHDALVGLEHLPLHEYDQIVTHNEAGEYGHKHHIQLHKYVTAQCKGKDVVTFGHGMRHVSHAIYLTEDEQRRKLAALQCYNHMLMYAGRMQPKCEALIHRYQLDMTTESYSAE